MTPELWERVKTIYDEISDSGPEERRLVLERLDEETRREVLKLLLNSDDPTEPGFRGKLLPDPEMIERLIRDHNTFETGVVLLKRFTIIRLLGSGGMGEVYEAEDRQLNERVGIKTLRLELVTLKDTREAFRREIRRGRQVAHQNVCRIYDLFEAVDREGDGIPFFTMELLSGETLLEAVRAHGPFPEKRAREIAEELCSGLQAAHEAGIIHGDFKGGNIFLAVDSMGVTRAKITDFGLARVAPSVESREAQEDGKPGGTKQYLAGEVMGGAQPSVQSDLFALGVVLYYIRTGEFPFDSDADWERTREERAFPPSLDLLKERLGADWARAISACLAPDPARRPESAEAVAVLLRPKIFTRRNVLLSILAALAAVGARFWRDIRPLIILPRGKLKTLVEDFGTTGGPIALGHSARNLMEVSLNSPERIVVVKPSEIQEAMQAIGLGGQSLNGPTARQVAARTRTRVLVSGDVTLEGNQYKIGCRAIDATSGRELLERHEVRIPLVDFPKGVSRLAQVLRERLGANTSLAQVGGSLTPLEQADTERADALESFTLGMTYYQNGDQQSALEHLAEATRLDPNFAIAHAYQGLALIAFGQLEQAVEPCAKAYALRGKLNQHHRLAVEFYHDILLGDYGGAHEKLQQLVQIFPNDANLNRQMARSYAVLEMPEESLTFARRAEALEPGSDMNKGFLASALAWNGRTNDANETLRRALQVSPDSPALKYAQADVHLLNLETDEALSLLNEIVRKKPDAILSRVAIVKAYMLGGRWEEARLAINRDLPILEFDRHAWAMDHFRYWLGQISSLHGDQATASEQAEILSQKNAVPLSLEAFRFAAELAWLAGNSELLSRVGKKLQDCHEYHKSKRSEGFLHFARALNASSLGEGDRALEEIQQADDFWPDLMSNCAYGELLLAKGSEAEALVQFEKVAKARAVAIDREAVNTWLRALARTASCLEALGRHAEAAPYLSQFNKLWGSLSQYTFAPRVTSAAL